MLLGAAEGQVSRVGTLAHDDLDEASGLVASARHRDVFWTHNDGDEGALYAVRSDGSTVARFRLDAKVQDWEDLARDEHGRLFVADTGNNDLERRALSIFELDEPDPATGKGKLAPLRRWRISSADGPFNCEALIVRNGEAYLITKYEGGRRADLYRFPLSAKRKAEVEKVATLPIREPVTSASISDDGNRLAVLAQGALYVFDINGALAKAAEVKPLRIPTPSLQLEGCCFADDGVVLVAESREVLKVKLPPSPATQSANAPATTPSR